MPIQGSAADILKKAMIDVHAALPAVAGGRARMILTVHDELLFEAPREAADETVAAVRRADGSRGEAEGAAHGRRRRRGKLERSQRVIG